ncbi:MAG: hypothetical protein ACR2M0_16275 [Chloroflexia bacterium]
MPPEHPFYGGAASFPTPPPQRPRRLYNAPQPSAISRQPRTPHSAIV